MQFLREVEANPNTKVIARHYRTTPEEHAALLAEKAPHIYMWPVVSHEQKTWHGGPLGAGGFELTCDFGHSCFISFDAPGSAPLFR